MKVWEKTCTFSCSQPGRIPPQHAVLDHPRHAHAASGILVPRSQREGTSTATGVKKGERTPRPNKQPHVLPKFLGSSASFPPRRGTMIQLLFSLLAAEGAVAATLLFKTPLRRLSVVALDRLKQGRGPVMVRTIAATVLVVLASSLHSMTKIRGRADGELDGAGIVGLTPTDQVLLARHVLEASLMGTHASVSGILVEFVHPPFSL